MKKTTLTFALMLLATLSFAHANVTSEAVKARMTLMTDFKAPLTLISRMARGSLDFDAEEAAEAKGVLLALAQDVPAKFSENVTEAASGAAPEIWTNWDDFLAKSEAFTAAVQSLDTSSPDGLGAGLGAIGAGCKSCHRVYRIK